MTVGSLFSGVGGLDLGLEWAGFETKWFCEIEQFPQQVLKNHWPGVPVYDDVKKIKADAVVPVDVIAGGFPCQDISWAGVGRGINYDLSEQEGTRSGLWWEMWRVIRDLRPRYVIAENVPALTHRGLDIVLGSLAQIGYDAEWQTISAASVGAPHIRERVFIVACANDPRPQGREGLRERGGQRTSGEGVSQPDWFGGPIGQPWPVSFKMGDTIGEGLEGDERSWLQREGRKAVGASDTGGQMGNTEGESSNGSGLHGVNSSQSQESKLGDTGGKKNEWVEVEYDFRGVAYGVSDRVGALKGYGNAVVPQVGYLVGRAVIAHYMEGKND